MTEPKQENSFLSAVERILMIVTIFILSPVALIHDCSGGKPFEFTSGKQIETSGTDVFGGVEGGNPISTTPLPEGECVRPIDPVQMDIWAREAGTREGVKGRLKNNPDRWEGYVKELIATSMKIDAMERARLKGNDGFVCAKNLAYVRKGIAASFKAAFGKEPGEFPVLPVNDLDGKQHTDSRTGELCFALQPAKEAWEEFESAYHKRTKGRVKPDSCMRGIERQLATKAIQVIACADDNTTPADDVIAACIVATNDTSGSHLTGEHVWGVAFDSHVGVTSAKKEAAAAGFYGGCNSKLNKSDMDHMSLLMVKKNGKGGKAVCQMRESVKDLAKGLKKGAKKLFGKIFGRK